MFNIVIMNDDQGFSYTGITVPLVVIVIVIILTKIHDHNYSNL